MQNSLPDLPWCSDKFFGDSSHRKMVKTKTATSTPTPPRRFLLAPFDSPPRPGPPLPVRSPSCEMTENWLSLRPFPSELLTPVASCFCGVCLENVHCTNTKTFASTPPRLLLFSFITPSQFRRPRCGRPTLVRDYGKPSFPMPFLCLLLRLEIRALPVRPPAVGTKKPRLGGRGSGMREGNYFSSASAFFSTFFFGAGGT